MHRICDLFFFFLSILLRNALITKHVYMLYFFFLNHELKARKLCIFLLLFDTFTAYLLIKIKRVMIKTCDFIKQTKISIY